MRILHAVEYYYPSKGGSQEVVRQLSERMVAMGHDVTVATSFLSERHATDINGVHIKEFGIKGSEVKGYQGDTKAYQEFLLAEKFDVIMVYAAQQWTADLFFVVMDKLPGRKIFVPCGYSGLFDPRYKNYFKKMPKILSKFDKTVYISPTYRDAVFAKKHKISNMVVIPNGADEKEFEKPPRYDIRKKYNIPKAAKLITHIGSFSGQKGQDEAVQIFDAANIKLSTLLLIGNPMLKNVYHRVLLKSIIFNIKPKNIKNKRKILVKNIPRQETVDSLKASDLFLFPSNIEASPLVIFESCAAGVPFLSTSVGNVSEIVEWTHGGELIPGFVDELGETHADINESAEKLKNLIADSRKLKELSKSGYAAFVKKYSWGEISKQYAKLYRGQL